MVAHAGQQRLCGGVAWFAVQCELEVVLNVVVPGIDQGVVGQMSKLLGKCGVQRVHIAPVVHIACTRVEQRVAREQRGLLGV